MNLKEVFNDKFYKDLIKCNFLKDVEEIIDNPGMINLDLDDFIKASNDEIVGCISQYFETTDENYIVNLISNKKPNSCIFYITSGTKLLGSDVSKLVSKLKDLYPDMAFNFGVGFLDESFTKIRVQVLLTYNKDFE